MRSRNVLGLGLRGMNNLDNAPAALLDDSKRITPKIALNCEVQDGGKLKCRDGYFLLVPLPGAHSLWAGSIMLAVANGILYRVEGENVMALTELAGPEQTVCYQEIDNLIFMSTKSWTGIYDLLNSTVRSWGLSLPPAPSFDIVPGDLPPGTYTFAYTRAENDRLSGNGPLAQISWQGGPQGIRFTNIPPGGQVWMTHPNGTDFFLADILQGEIMGQAPTNIPLPSFKVAPPPGMAHFAFAFGRIWGCSGKKLVYSDPFQFEWFRPEGFKPFIEEIFMVAPVNEGIFINSASSTWFLDGTDPAKMVLKRVGDGAVPDSLVYAELPGAVVGGGYEMSRRLSQLPSPVWIGQHGVVVGTQTGHLVHLTQSRLRMGIRARGGGVFRVKNGVPQIISVLRGPLLNESQTTEAAIFKNGNLFD